MTDDRRRFSLHVKLESVRLESDQNHFSATFPRIRLLESFILLKTGTPSSTSWLSNSVSWILYLMLSPAPPGGRGLKVDVWTDKRPRSLDEIWSYNQNTSGYRAQWIDALPHVFPREDELFASRTSGFLVPPLSGNFNIYLHCDDRCDLYLSNSSRPEDKVKVAFQPRYVGDFFQLESQKSEVLFLEKGKPYYLELLQQEYYGIASLNIGLFQEESSFTAAQADAPLCLMSTVHQVLTFDSWSSGVAAVREVQKVSVSSGCASHLCGSTFFSLRYGNAQTGDLLAPASAEELQAALNNLWSIKPDSVTVTKQEDDQGSHYTVTFNSDRGDFAPLNFEVFGSEVTNVSISEVTKGQSNMAAFTLSWAGFPAAPVVFNATASEVQSVLEDLMKADCPAEVLASQGTNVKYFNDFEDPGSGTPEDHSGFCGFRSLKNPEVLQVSEACPLSPQLCFAYKGRLRDEMGLKFSYSDSSGQTRTQSSRISTAFSSGDR
uniref:PKHD1 like 1, tandem duplicate 2 n=1 Tax=Poecilia reticulata TaxID=8081 RepID=A0A3P9PH78_POERE